MPEGAEEDPSVPDDEDADGRDERSVLEMIDRTSARDRLANQALTDALSALTRRLEMSGRVVEQEETLTRITQNIYEYLARNPAGPVNERGAMIEALSSEFEKRVKKVVDGEGLALWGKRALKIGPIVSLGMSIPVIVKMIQDAVSKAPHAMAALASSPEDDTPDPAAAREIARMFLDTPDPDFWQSYVDFVSTPDTRLPALDHTVWMGMVLYLSQYLPPRPKPWVWTSPEAKQGKVLALAEAIGTGGMIKAYGMLVDDARTLQVPRQVGAEVMGLALTKWWMDRQD